MQLLNITYFKEKNFTKILLGTVLLGIALRVLVNYYGGQLFWFDEMRFNNGYIILTTISDGQYDDAIKKFITTYDHTFYQLFAIPLTVLRYYWCKLFLNSNIEPYFLMEYDSGLAFCSAFISIICYLILVLFSLKIFCKFNLNWKFAIIPVVLYSFSSIIIIFSRHLLPYEISITMYVVSISLLMHNKYYLSGFICTSSFLTYNGFSASFLSIIIFSVIFILFYNKKILRNFIIYSLGILKPLLILQFIGHYFGLNYINGLMNWAKYASINQQGDFGIGYKLIPELFWQSESYLSLLIIFPFFIKINSDFFKSYKNFLLSTFYLCISTISIIVFNSDLHKSSVVYFRTIIQIVPFMCLFVSIGIFFFYKKYETIIGLKLNLLIISMLFLIFYINLNKYITLDYPRNILNSYSLSKEATKLSNFIDNTSNISSIEINDKTLYISNLGQIYPGIKYFKDYKFNKILNHWKHPYRYIPYQYMHFNQEERSLLNSNNFDIVCGYIKK